MNIVQFLKGLISPVSAGYSLVDENARAEGWKDPAVARRQHDAYAPLLRDLRRGQPREDLRAAADAVRESRIDDPSLLEIGCGSGYYSEVLETLAGVRRYAGIDYSAAMVIASRHAYPHARFVLGDATQLPFRNNAFDIAFSGNSLMHIPDYGRAIAETARVARRWVVFHSVPVLRQRATAHLRKKAYSAEVVELTFNESDLEARFRAASLEIRSVRETIAYDLAFILGENTRMVTYTCEKIERVS